MSEIAGGLAGWEAAKLPIQVPRDKFRRRVAAGDGFSSDVVPSGCHPRRMGEKCFITRRNRMGAVFCWSKSTSSLRWHQSMPWMRRLTSWSMVRSFMPRDFRLEMNSGETP